jgi:DNA-binding NtrC family response regulator
VGPLPFRRKIGVGCSGSPLSSSSSGFPITTPAASGSDLKSLERAAIERALNDARHNESKAAKILGLTRTQLYVRLRKYGMD